MHEPVRGQVATCLVCVPLNRGELAGLAGGSGLVGPRPAYTPGEALARTFELADPLGEEAEFAALQVAAVQALTGGEPLVVIAHLPAGRLGAHPDPEQAGNGGVLLDGLAAGEVESFFTMEPGPELDRAALAAAGRGLEDAWQQAEVQALLAVSDLLWHSAVELPAASDH